MAKEKTVYVCSNCGQDSPKWVGKCLSFLLYVPA